jgi:hypothetical protein
VSDHYTTVVIEYMPLAYMGRNGTDGADGFESGCSLQLLSIGVLSESDFKEFDFESPRKRKGWQSRIGLLDR